MKFKLQHFAAKTIWWDSEDRTYVCATAAQVTSDVAAFAAASRDNGPELFAGIKLLYIENGKLYFWDTVEFQPFGGA